MSNAVRTSPSQAGTRRSRWPGWIWAIPIAAFGITAWLLVRALAQGGTEITITFPDVHGIDPKNTDINYLGMKIGHVTGVSLAKDGHSVKVIAKVQDSASKFLKTETVFWLQSPSPSNLSSFGALFSGPKIMMQPGSGKSETHFNGLAHKPLPANHGAAVLFVVPFEGTVGELSQGDTVKVRGFPVGEVKRIDFHYDAITGKIESPVTLALYPDLFHIEGARLPNRAEALKAALDQLVTEGLRARLEREPPFIGSYQVNLDMVPGLPSARMKISDHLPEIPTAPGGGLESIATRFKKIPVEQISQHVLGITKNVEKIVSSAKLRDSVAQLDASLREIRRVIKDVGPKMTQLAQSLDSTAKQLDQTAKAANKTLGGAPSQTGLQDTLREIKEAARAVRSLADYLDRHPEALISGRPGE
ncbi:MAG TPA: MlaD family protein [Terriglobales bacterium]|nr:MlaD family protein [Terriglobales bacterium]